VHSEAIVKVLLALADRLKEAVELDLRECFVDGTVVAGKKRGGLVGKNRRGEGTKIMGIAHGLGPAVGLRPESAWPAEVKLVAPAMEERIVADAPERLIRDKAHDGDRSDQDLIHTHGTEIIAANAERRCRLAGRPAKATTRRSGSDQ
jgi:hypothetical protein